MREKNSRSEPVPVLCAYFSGCSRFGVRSVPCGTFDAEHARRESLTLRTAKRLQDIHPHFALAQTITGVRNGGMKLLLRLLCPVAFCVVCTATSQAQNWTET